MEDLQDVGLFDPSLEMMIKHISECDTMQFNPKNPMEWKGYVIFFDLMENPEELTTSFIGHHKFRKACFEARENPINLIKLSGKYGLVCKLPDGNVKVIGEEVYYRGSFIIKLTPEESRRQFAEFEEILGK